MATVLPVSRDKAGRQMMWSLPLGSYIRVGRGPDVIYRNDWFESREGGHGRDG